MYGWIFEKSWLFWLTVLLLIIFVIWIFDGRKHRQFIGTAPLCVGVDSSAYMSVPHHYSHPTYHDTQSSHTYSTNPTYHDTHSSLTHNTNPTYHRDHHIPQNTSHHAHHHLSPRDQKEVYDDIRKHANSQSSSIDNKRNSQRENQTEKKRGPQRRVDELLETLSSISDSDVIWTPGTTIDLTPPLPPGLESCVSDRSSKLSYPASTADSAEQDIPGDFSTDSEDTCTLDIPIATPPPYKSGFKSKGELKCCEAAERIFGVKFHTVRPDFLKNPETKRNLEIDCYNHKLKIGIEYNGISHYCHPNYTGATYEEFVKQVKRDQLKVDLCDKHGVYLITVPYHVKEKDIEAYIRYYSPEAVAARS